MANYNKPNGNNKNIGMVVITIVFAIIGIVCFIIGYNNEIISWMKTFGIVILVLLLPLIVFLVYKFIIEKIKDI